MPRKPDFELLARLGDAAFGIVFPSVLARTPLGSSWMTNPTY